MLERTTLTIVGWCFIALAFYIVYESGSTLIRHDAPERSMPGIVMAAVSLVAMPLLARAKRRVASGIESAAMHARLQTSGLLCIPVGHSLGRIASKCAGGLVVG